MQLQARRELSTYRTFSMTISAILIINASVCPLLQGGTIHKRFHAWAVVCDGNGHLQVTGAQERLAACVTADAEQNNDAEETVHELTGDYSHRTTKTYAVLPQPQPISNKSASSQPTL